MLKVAILGCGPAGLLAAQGVVDSKVQNIEIRVFSRKSKSDLHGAQYLHRPIPGFTLDVGEVIDYKLVGSPEDYRAKVYGQAWHGTVSPEELGEPHKGWDIRRTYDRLWLVWGSYIEDVWLNEATIQQIRHDFKPDLVISSIRRDTVCDGRHFFHSQSVVAAGDAPSLGIQIPYQCPPNTVICNGERDVAWYRISNIFGHKTVEWGPTIVRAPLNSAATVQKPLSTDCDCHPDFKWVGRYGKWQKGVLSHTAYWDAMKYAEEVGS